LSERGFHALVAIAEKSSTESRQGSVRWNHIRDGLYGASLSTAKRAVRDLKEAGLIRVVKRGFNNQNGRACAPIYEMAPLTERITQVNHSRSQRTGQIEKRMGHIRDRTGHPGDPLDGSIDGSIDERERPPSTTNPALSQISPISDDLEPPPHCDAHMPYGTGESCRRCKTHRINHERWLQRNPHRANARNGKPHKLRALAELAAETRGIELTNACRHCDHGWLIGDDGTPLDPVVRCPHCRPAIITNQAR
jgi:hypothetical protein